MLILNLEKIEIMEIIVDDSNRVYNRVYKVEGKVKNRFLSDI